MYVVHLASEFAPIAKVGGLGDVVAALSKTLIQMGVRVEVILPFYDQIDRKVLGDLHVEKETFSFKEKKWTIYRALYSDIPLLLFESPFFERGAIYGEKDDLDRFTSFTEVAMDYLLEKNKRLDILHLHDWLTAFAAPLYFEKYQQQNLQIDGIVLTVHNMKYQGVFSPEKHSMPIDKLKKKMEDPKNPKKLNLLQGGLTCANFLTTVSPTYAKEMQGKEGFGLEETVIKRRENLVGILNGIDTTYWNPETDSYLAKNYDAISDVQTAKQENRKALYQKLGMKEGKGPLFTCISRLVEQKGPELIAYGIDYILEKGGHFVLLGSTPQPGLETLFASIAKKYENHPHAHFHFTFDEPLAHLTYGAADAILIPSIFEPCGLTQMIALRYGTIPIVHQVGGLNDTVFDIDDPSIPEKEKNGYTFNAPTKEKLKEAIDRAFDHYENHPKKWSLMQQSGFAKDWSLDLAAKKYLQVYKNLSH
ncbi:MAG: glycogen synthase [Chlamydiia bacterium]|nr:glycogen synthase [Chlamydiia bacterium]